MSDERSVSPPDAEQDTLFDVEPDWKEHWQGMPEYSHQDLQPWQSVIVHFKTQRDREDFARLVGQRLHAKTKFIWHPKAEIGTAADKVFTGVKMTPRYPIYIISKGRWESRLTSKALEWIKVPYRIVVEPQEFDKYAAVIDPAKILVTPFSNLGLGGIPARNFVWEHAISTGAARHWILDDNIDGFCRFQDNLKVEVDNGATFCAVEDWVDRYENVAMAAFNYDYFAPRKQGAKIKPITLNTRCYSGILLSNTLTPHRWRGRYNEDTDLSLRILKDGLCTALFNAFLMYKKPTLTMKGGNTDELYAGVEATVAEWTAHAASCPQCSACVDGYTSKTLPCDSGRAILEKDGRWRMAEDLRAQHPDLTTVERKWQRWQHQVDYRAFRPEMGKNVLRLRADVVIPTEANDYGMALDKMPEPGAEGSFYAAPLRSRPVPAPAPPAPHAPAQTTDAPGPSALAFARQQPAEPVAGPTVLQPATASEDSGLGKAPAQEETPATSQPGPAPAAAPAETQTDPDRTATARQLRDQLAARGHRLLTRDDKFFISNTAGLTTEDREAIKQLRDQLVLLAEPWIDPPPPTTPLPPAPPPLQETPVPQTAPVTFTSTDTLLEAAPRQTLAQFLGDQPRYASVGQNWVPDTPPDLTGIDEIVLNFATTGLDWANGARPCGVTVSTLDGKLTKFLPFGFQGGGNLDEATVKRWAQEQLRGKKITNSKTKFDIHQARVWELDLEEQGCTFSDIQHTAALLDDHRKRFGIDALAADYFPGEHFAARVDESRHHEHHAAEVAERELVTAQLVGRLRAVMYPELEKQELIATQRLEDAVIPAVVEMEKNGSPLDLELLEQFHRECHAKHDELMWEVSRECGFAFEHSAKGWQRLFESLGLPPTDSNNEATITQIVHPLVQKGYLASQYAQLASKTFDAYKANVGADGVLRFEINQLKGEKGGTVSGRFSIGYVQQVPNADNHSAVFGSALFPRRLFIPGSGAYLEADAMQIEQRLLVHYMDNAKIIAEYAGDLERLQRGEETISFHKVTWAMMKQYKADMLYSHQKSFNFAKQYGARSIKLAVMMKFITEEEGDEIRRNKRWNDPRLATIHEIEKAYSVMVPEGDALLERAAHLAKPACDEYCKRGDALHRQYQHRGYVKTLVGRRSRFPTNYKTYIGLNRVLQGTGADIMKQKLAELHRERKQTGLVMRLTVHDAVGGDATQPETQARVSEILNRQSFALKVPILWSTNTGRNWAECK